MAALALRRLFDVDRDVLYRVEVFHHLGWLLSYDDNNKQAVHALAVKA